MTIERALLKEAWPDGFLPMRGMRTVGGWECVMAGEHLADPKSVRFIPGPAVDVSVRVDVGSRGIHRWEVEGSVVPNLMSVWEAGDLLPNVDPADTATWACLLEDLARSAFLDPELPKDQRWWVSGWTPCMIRAVDHPGSAHRVGWASPMNPDAWVPGWRLDVSCGATGVITVNKGFRLDVEDPALALVLARTQVRKDHGR